MARVEKSPGVDGRASPPPPQRPARGLQWSAPPPRHPWRHVASPRPGRRALDHALRARPSSHAPALFGRGSGRGPPPRPPRTRRRPRVSARFRPVRRRKRGAGKRRRMDPETHLCAWTVGLRRRGGRDERGPRASDGPWRRPRRERRPPELAREQLRQNLHWPRRRRDTTPAQSPTPRRPEVPRRRSTAPRGGRLGTNVESKAPRTPPAVPSRPRLLQPRLRGPFDGAGVPSPQRRCGAPSPPAAAGALALVVAVSFTSALSACGAGPTQDQPSPCELSFPPRAGRSPLRRATATWKEGRTVTKEEEVSPSPGP